MTTMTPEDIKKMQNRRKANARRMVALAVACELCPQVTEEVAKLVLNNPPRLNRQKVTQGASRNAQSLLDSAEWRDRLVAWVDDFWSRHGHGPTWRGTKKAEALWPEGCTEGTKTATMQMLPKTGLLDGMKTPYSMRVRREEKSA